jgi:hypothetical protein
MTTPGTRRTWHTGRQWVAHLRDLHRRRGTRAKVYRDLDAHLAALDRASIRGMGRANLEAIREALELVKPARGHRAGTDYERIVNETHNELARLARRQRDLGLQLVLPLRWAA